MRLGLLASKMENGTMNQGIQWPPEAGEGTEMDSP
jgi:hypothetical protein